MKFVNEKAVTYVLPGVYPTFRSMLMLGVYTRLHSPLKPDSTHP